MSIILTPAHEQAIHRHGEETFPHECCGFILGHTENNNKRVTSLLRASNTREDEARHDRFLISPDEFMQAETKAREQGMDVIGIYHSHPNAAARPSQVDQDHAWPWYSYIIVSIMNQRADHMHSWVLKDDRSAFDQEDVVIES